MNVACAWQRALKILEQWKPLGETTASTGARLIGHVPHVAPMAYMHIIYPGLDDGEIAELERRCGNAIPDDYSDFLRQSNGANLFTDKLRLNGLRASYRRDADASCLPYAMETANTHERPAGSPREAVFFGGYSYDGSRLWMKASDPRVFRCPRREFLPTLNEWPTLGEMLESEIRRLNERFDEQGVLIDRGVPTTPEVRR